MSFDKAMAAWAETWGAENIDGETRRLIGQATFDLYHGPVGDGAYGDPAEGDDDWSGYPGFTTACARIAKGLTLPSVVYFDHDCGGWQETEPEAERCEACDGQGEVDSDDLDANGESLGRVKCLDCSGRGGFDPCGDWYPLERADMKRALLGVELAPYVEVRQ